MCSVDHGISCSIEWYTHVTTIKIVNSHLPANNKWLKNNMEGHPFNIDSEHQHWFWTSTKLNEDMVPF